MSDANQEPIRQVLIASANPLFARGLQKLMAQHWGDRNVEVRLASNMVEVTAVLQTWHPDLVIVDYEEVGGQVGKSGHIQRKAFLNYFIAEDRPMRVMLVSLRASGEVVVYDRRSLTPAQAEDWLDQPWGSSSGSSSLPINVTGSAGKTNSTDSGAARPADADASANASANAGANANALPGASPCGGA